MDMEEYPVFFRPGKRGGLIARVSASGKVVLPQRGFSPVEGEEYLVTLEERDRCFLAKPVFCEECEPLVPARLRAGSRFPARCAACQERFLQQAAERRCRSQGHRLPPGQQQGQCPCCQARTHDWEDDPGREPLAEAHTSFHDGMGASSEDESYSSEIVRFPVVCRRCGGQDWEPELLHERRIMEQQQGGKE